jgi:hypothetical protein
MQADEEHLRRSGSGCAAAAASDASKITVPHSTHGFLLNLE